MKDMDFAALLCSRLCHDLVSPVGAINNGLEILQDEKDASMREAVFDLIEKSSRQTANKLQFFRLAFGAAGGFSANLDMQESERALRAFLDGSRVTLVWHSSLASAPKSLVKLLLNVALVGSEALIRGGTLSVALDEADEDGYAQVAIECSGDKVILPDTIRAALQGKVPDEELDARTAPAFLAATLAAEHGGSVTVDWPEDQALRIVGTLRLSSE